jgi:hypothetical protein
MMFGPFSFSRLGHRAKAHQRVVGAPVGLAAHVGDRETQVDQAVIGKRERRIVQRLQQRTGDHVGLAMAALP